MSLGYASRLSVKDDYGGQLGAKEFSDSTRSLKLKISKLATWVSEAKSIVIFTGAGISTSCGIPDFRGPQGVWTLQRLGKQPPEMDTSFDIAKPSLTHQAIAALVSCGKVPYVVSQNVDGLHVRSGISRRILAELHGNCFAERCERCEKVYVRDFEMRSVGFKLTGRTCTRPGCKGSLRDHILDWEDALPEDELAKSEEMAEKADLALCLGTSLQIIPACDIPVKTLKAGGRLVIVNLQKTPKDRKANMILHAKTDDVMAAVMKRLDMVVPDYVREDRFVLRHRQTLPSTSSSQKETFTYSFEVVSRHGEGCPLPMLDSVDIQYLDSHAKIAHVQLSAPFHWKTEQPLDATITLTVTLNFGKGADEDKRSATLDYVMKPLSHDQCVEAAKEVEKRDFLTPSTLVVAHQQEHIFTTQRVCYEPKEEETSQKRRRQK